jgi:hypothetical protein
MSEPDWALEPGDEEKYLNWHGWERHLSPRDKWRLVVARATLEPEHEADFSLAYARKHASAEFHDDLHEAGADPAELALVRLEAELDSYPAR